MHDVDTSVSVPLRFSLLRCTFNQCTDLLSKKDAAGFRSFIFQFLPLSLVDFVLLVVLVWCPLSFWWYEGMVCDGRVPVLVREAQ